MKENALKRRNEHLITFYLVWGYFVSSKKKTKEKKLHDMLSTPSGRTYLP